MGLQIKKESYLKQYDAKHFIGKTVQVTIDRPIGSKHPKFQYTYPVNYGYIENTISGDGEELDAYILNVTEPLKKFTGTCVAIITREDDDDDKLIIIPFNSSITDTEIRELTYFQEKWFTSNIIR